MKKLWMPVVVLFVITIGVGPATAQKPSDKPVVRLDPALDGLVSPDAKLELVKGGFGFTEGALWVQQGKRGYLLFSDIPANVIYKWTPDGKLSVYLDHSGYTGQDIWRVGFIQTNGKNRNDPLFEEFPMIGSNGLALDRQGRLIIATWAGRSIDRIEKNGKRTVLADRDEGKRFGGTDGLRVDIKGNLYETAAGGVWIISPEGKHLGTILTPELTANVEFGDADRKTLYIAARTSIYKIRLNTPGIP